MPLFRDHPVRSTIAVAIAMSVGHFITGLLTSVHAFHLTQTSVAILAISSLMFLVTMHHRRDGQMLTRTQEEMVLICGFGLFWMAALLAWRALSQSSMDPGKAGELGFATESGSYREPGFTGGRRPYPCSSDDLYCVVEDYTFF
ncbi:hypothetical protein BDZ94DRAFT_1161622 [Collybia nuda]|uniref:Uncharacterized protein n=1 Tax=Collybia nuda TaxID=64659 RepID=A0A9P6CL73_9AGAR|nr:hypothetical protein BDZ94DRAFT_1161622 [Collybia nuda]